MGCCGDREKGIQVSEEQKWDYITLSDFKSTSCFAPFSYAWLWILVIVSGAVYAADAFTAVNLLAFNKWSSQVRPKVSFDVAKWIFAVTIILSYVFLIYRWVRALRVIRSGSVTECYLEPLAAIWQSMRLTKSGQGWRRFLVFAELTRSRKGVDYIALFVYFQFKSALLIVVAQGPRIVINALTLWAVMQAQLIPVGEHAAPKDRSAFVQFFMNIKTMAETGNRQETIIYFTMLFSLVIWVFAALGLLISVIFYVFFLWHYIPQSDGSLTAYCRRKIEGRLERIVGKKIKKALEKEEQKRVKEERKAIKKGDLDAARMPTLPKLGGDDDKMSAFGIQRSDTLSTVSTLPPYSAASVPSRTNTMSTTRSNGMRPPMPTLGERPPPLRTDTGASYGSNAPLLSQASEMGRSSPAPPMPTMDRNGDRLAPGGPYAQPYSPVSPISPRGPLGPANTSHANDRYVPPLQPVSPLYNNTRGPQDGESGWSPYGDNRSNNNGDQYFEMSPVDANSGPRHYYSNSNESDDYKPPQLPGILRPGSPAMSQASSAAPSRAGTAPPSNPRAGLPATLQSAMQRREASQPLPNRGMTGSVPQQRSATAPIQQPNWGPSPTARSNTTTPGPRGYNNGYNNGY